MEKEVNIIQENDNQEELVYEIDTANAIQLVDTANEEIVLTHALVSEEHFQAEYSRLMYAQDALKEIRASVNSKIVEMMKGQYLIDGTKKIEGNKMNFTLMPESYREGFDMKAFKEAEPELYEELFKKYNKITRVSESVRVTRKKEDK